MNVHVEVFMQDGQSIGPFVSPPVQVERRMMEKGGSEENNWNCI
jgi:hypothetical protein